MSRGFFKIYFFKDVMKNDDSWLCQCVPLLFTRVEDLVQACSVKICFHTIMNLT